MENTIVRNGWFLGIPLWLREFPSMGAPQQRWISWIVDGKSYGKYGWLRIFPSNIWKIHQKSIQTPGNGSILYRGNPLKKPPTKIPPYGLTTRVFWQLHRLQPAPSALRFQALRLVFPRPLPERGTMRNPGVWQTTLSNVHRFWPMYHV